MRPRLSSAIATAVLVLSCAAIGYPAGPLERNGSITGTVRFAGAPLKPVQLEVSKDREACGVHPLFDQSLLVGPDHGIANAVVTIPIVKGGMPLKPANAVRFEQKGCEYTPHLAVFPAGSTVEVINSDGILHNIHTESTINPVLDMAQPGFKKTIRIRIEKPEAIKVTCDAHNWMEGWWYATGNPYYAMTDAHGHYTLNNVPSGTHELRVWQEKLGERTMKVTVKPGAAVVADFTLAPNKQ